MGIVSSIWQDLLRFFVVAAVTILLGTGFARAVPSLEYQHFPSPPKTAIAITYPKSGTIWKAPSIVNISWTTRNIAPEKTIKFYLSKDDMVVQELGTFTNNGTENNIVLEGNLPEGDNYRVIGFELFPDDKSSIAKYATGLFTIVKAPRENVTVPPPTIRHDFDGRKLAYVKEIQVRSTNIQITLWDHGRTDGDIVSIYLNGEAIVSQHTLAYEKEHFDVTLDPNKSNDLFLYAHNLGKFPPNTVSIEVLDDTTSEKLVLDSDLKSCEAVMIRVGEQGTANP